MTRWLAYRAQITAGEREGNFVVSFPDVPQAITEGGTRRDAVAMAQEVLQLSLVELVTRGQPLPRAKARHGTLVAVEPQVAAKLFLLER